MTAAEEPTQPLTAANLRQLQVLLVPLLGHRSAPFRPSSSGLFQKPLNLHLWCSRPTDDVCEPQKWPLNIQYVSERQVLMLKGPSWCHYVSPAVLGRVVRTPLWVAPLGQLETTK